MREWCRVGHVKLVTIPPDIDVVVMSVAVTSTATPSIIPFTTRTQTLRRLPSVTESVVMLKATSISTVE